MEPHYLAVWSHILTDLWVLSRNIPGGYYCTIIKARDVAEIFGSQPLTLGTAVAGRWNFTVWVVTRRLGVLL